jgi:hypothetical protein
MAGLVPAIHVLLLDFMKQEDVDARHKAGHDEWRVIERRSVDPAAD